MGKLISAKALISWQSLLGIALITLAWFFWGAKAFLLRDVFIASNLAPPYNASEGTNNPTPGIPTSAPGPSPNRGGGSGVAYAQHNHGGMAMDAPSGEKEPKSTFYVSPRRQQMIGVKTEEVKVRPMEKQIRTVGIVELDETKIEQVNTKISGWIEEVFVDFTWQYVERGDALFSIYSPELVATQEELLLALKYNRALSKSEFTEISSGANSLVEAARRRLRLWDITREQIREIERTGRVKRSLVIHSPITGYVTFKNAFENMHVTPNTKVYTVADYSTVWVYADIYENEISLVKLGQEASLTVDPLPGERFRGKVTYIWPKLDPKTRTVKVRMEFPNPDLKLFSGMYANVELGIPLGERLTVVESAVLRTGKRNLVFVDKGEGNMELRKVELGHKAGDYYQVLRGLREGERVVASANFLIDAESKLKAVITSWGEGAEETAVHEPISREEMEVPALSPHGTAYEQGAKEGFESEGADHSAEPGHPGSVRNERDTLPEMEHSGEEKTGAMHDPTGGGK